MDGFYCYRKGLIIIEHTNRFFNSNIAQKISLGNRLECPLLMKMTETQLVDHSTADATW